MVLEQASILRPTRLYADTAILRNISRDRCDGVSRDAFVELLATGGAVLVLSHVHMVEIAKTSEDLVADPLTRLLSPIVDGGRIVWIRTMTALCAMEWAQAVRETGDGRLSWDRISGSSLISTGGGLGEGALLPVSDPPFLQQVQIVRDSLQRTSYSENARRLAVVGLSFSQKRRMKRPKPSRPYSEAERIFRVIQWCPSHVEPPAGFRPELSRMPACRVRVAYEEGSDLSSTPLQASDTEDWHHLAGAAYCDIAFADKRTIDRLKKARHVPPALHANGEAPRVLRSLLTHT